VTLKAVNVPDLGGADEVEVIEINVAVGDRIAIDDPLMALESDKASMDMPASAAGVVKAIHVRVGDKVSTGVHAFDVETEDAAAEPASATTESPQPSNQAPNESSANQSAAATPAETPVETAPQDAAGSQRMDIIVPDLGGADSVEVVEVLIASGDTVAEGDGIAVLEGDKASMDLPAMASGVIDELTIAVGQQVKTGDRIGSMTVAGAVKAVPAAAVTKSEPAISGAPSSAPAAPESSASPAEMTPPTAPQSLRPDDGIAGITRVHEQGQKRAGPQSQKTNPRADIYAGPAVRGLARDFGVELSLIQGSGPRGRIVKEDVQNFVKARLNNTSAAPAAGSGVPPVPEVDFSQFGEVEEVALNGIQKATVTSMSRSWLNVPHVTQFDYADVTELEAFRKTLKPEMDARKNKLTPLPFLLLAVARALRENPRFNSSIHPDGTRIFLKKYCNIGIAVDTPNGLMVPVIRDVDQKSVWDLAEESRELAAKARDRKLKPAEMQGGCFTISSLGNIGGEGFTPIVNAPEVAILGVSKLDVRPVWDGSSFQPRQTLPLSLSYDHKVINGADAGRFMTYLCGVLADIRRLLL